MASRMFIRPARTAGSMAASLPANTEMATKNTRSSHGTAGVCTNDSGSASVVATPEHLDYIFEQLEALFDRYSQGLAELAAAAVTGRAGPRALPRCRRACDRPPDRW